MATDRTETAKAFLDRATSDLERYLGISTPTTASAVSLVDAFPSKTTATTTANTQTGIANLSGKGSGQWVERGVVEVNVVNLPIPEDISNDLDFQKVAVQVVYGKE